MWFAFYRKKFVNITSTSNSFFNEKVRQFCNKLYLIVTVAVLLIKLYNSRIYSHLKRPHRSLFGAVGDTGWLAFCSAK